MFTKEQVQYLRDVLKLQYDFSDQDALTVDEWMDIEDTVANHLQYCGFDENYKPTSDGVMCESLIDEICRHDGRMT